MKNLTQINQSEQQNTVNPDRNRHEGHEPYRLSDFQGFEVWAGCYPAFVRGWYDGERIWISHDLNQDERLNFLSEMASGLLAECPALGEVAEVETIQ